MLTVVDAASCNNLRPYTRAYASIPPSYVLKRNKLIEEKEGWKRKSSRVAGWLLLCSLGV